MLIWAISTNGSLSARSSGLFYPIIPPEPALSANLQFDIGFTATSILHPATYLNKVLVASNEGDMQLWNIRTQCVESCAIILLNSTLLQNLYTQIFSFSVVHITVSTEYEYISEFHYSADAVPCH